MKTLSIRHDEERIREHCIERAAFNTHGALWGAPVYSTDRDRLPEEYHDSFKRAEYAVFSYSTPIAWYGPDGWTFPDVKYSVTTSRHQSRIGFIRNWIEKW